MYSWQRTSWSHYGSMPPASPVIVFSLPQEQQNCMGPHSFAHPRRPDRLRGVYAVNATLPSVLAQLQPSGYAMLSQTPTLYTHMLSSQESSLVGP